jgi:hypothetical protein
VKLSDFAAINEKDNYAPLSVAHFSS